MTLLNEADAIYLGDQLVEKVYAGSTQVWPPVVVTGPASHLVTSFTPGFIRNEFTGEVGMRFWLTANKTFSWLGVYCCSGNTGLHRVHLYDWDAPSSPLLTVDIDLTGKTAGALVWASITPIALTASSYYVVVKETTAGGQFWFEEGPTTLDPTLSSDLYSVYRSPGGSITPYTANYHYVGLDLGW